MHFPDNQRWWAPLHMFTGHSNIFFAEVFVQGFWVKWSFYIYIFWIWVLWQTSKLEILFSCLQFAFSFKKNDGEDFIYLFWPHCTTYGILVLWPGIELEHSALKAHSSNHLTTGEFPAFSFLTLSSVRRILKVLKSPV